MILTLRMILHFGEIILKIHDEVKTNLKKYILLKMVNFSKVVSPENWAPVKFASLENFISLKIASAEKRV